MIHIDELKEGSWVHFVDDIPVMIRSKLGNTVLLGIRERDNLRANIDGYKNLANLAPIPLTAEMLEKLGFEKQENEKSKDVWYRDPRCGYRLPFLLHDDKEKLLYPDRILSVHRLQMYYDDHKYPVLDFTDVL